MSENKRTTLFGKLMAAHAMVLLFAVLILAAAFYYYTANYLGNTANEEMMRADRLAQNAIQRYLGGAAVNSRLLAENYVIRSGLRIRNTVAISDQITHELGAVGADFVSVAAADGVVICNSTRIAQQPEVSGLSCSEPLFLSPSFQTVSKSGVATAGIEPVYPNSIAVVAIAPIGGDTPEPLGFVRIGYYLDRRFISSVRALSHTDLAIEYRGAIIAATVKVDGGEPALPEKLSAQYLTYRLPIMSGGRTVAHLLALYPKSKIADVQRRGFSAIAIITCIAFAVSALASVRLARNIAGPVNELMAGAKRLQDGDLTHRITGAGNNELGSLAAAFNRMAESLQQRDAEIRSNRDQLIESGKLAALGELAAGIAHEIGNPLAAIFGYIQLLNDAKEDKRGHYLEEMAKEVGFIDTTIRELLDFSRPSKTENEVVSLDEAADEALRMLTFHKSMKYVDISRERATEPPLVSGSRKELVQAVLNISLNAAQAMHGHGKLTLRTENGAEYVIMRISDTGPGIAEKDLPHIFDPFFTTKHTGTGLGLSITYRIVQRHSGTIRVETSPDKGTAFILRFPSSYSPASDKAEPPAQ